MLTRDQVLLAVNDCARRSPEGTARTSDLAVRLGVKGPSVTARVQELAALGLVEYAPRQGAALTEEGNRQAKEVLRKLDHIEHFLHVVFGFPAEVCRCEAEHLLRHVSEIVMTAIAQHAVAHASTSSVNG